MAILTDPEIISIYAQNKTNLIWSTITSLTVDQTMILFYLTFALTGTLCECRDGTHHPFLVSKGRSDSLDPLANVAVEGYRERG
jgi:hypothetical protein